MNLYKYSQNWQERSPYLIWNSCFSYVNLDIDQFIMTWPDSTRVGHWSLRMYLSGLVTERDVAKVFVTVCDDMLGMSVAVCEEEMEV